MFEQAILENIESAERWLTDAGKDVIFVDYDEHNSNAQAQDTKLWKAPSYSCLKSSIHHMNEIIRDHLTQKKCYYQMDLEDSIGFISDLMMTNEYTLFDMLACKNLSLIIDYKIKNEQSFGNFEAVFEAASEADKEKLLFHLK